MGFFSYFTDKTAPEPAEAQLTAYVSGRVQGWGSAGGALAPPNRWV